eukprot:3853839-Pleurochrysis_carterae.AAC.1
MRSGCRALPSSPSPSTAPANDFQPQSLRCARGDRTTLVVAAAPCTLAISSGHFRGGVRRGRGAYAYIWCWRAPATAASPHRTRHAVFWSY